MTNQSPHQNTADRTRVMSAPKTTDALWDGATDAWETARAEADRKRENKAD